MSSNESQWQQYLREQYPQVFAEHPYVEEADEQIRVVPLLHLGLLSVAGKDSEKFMQGQFTCDLNESSPQKTLQGAVCTPQGRMFSSFKLIQRDENLTEGTPTFWLAMAENLVADTQATLHKYSVFFKTDMEPLNDQYVGIGLIGNKSQALLEEFFSSSLSRQAVNQLNTGTVSLLEGEEERWECWLEQDTAQTLLQSIAAEAQVTAPDEWIAKDIAAGIAQVEASTVEAFTPHMLNLDITGAVSFDKGCYTGQEIVARTHYRGQVKRRLLRCLLTGSVKPATGSNLQAIEGNSNLGRVVSSVSRSAESHEILAVLGVEQAAELAQVSIDNHSYQLEQLPLPYDL